MVEHGFLVPGVGGSSPPPPAKSFADDRISSLKCKGHTAAPRREAGSSPEKRKASHSNLSSSEIG